MLCVTFTSCDEPDTDVDETDHQNENSFLFVNLKSNLKFFQVFNETIRLYR